MYLAFLDVYSTLALVYNISKNGDREISGGEEK